MWKRLAPVLLSDYRNFAHGRHHWFAKKGKNSSIIAIVTPSYESLAKNTLAILPKEINKIIIKSDYKSSFASIDLLVKSFYLTDELGSKLGIDPGRPGVPEYGRKLYNLRYTSMFRKKKVNGISSKCERAILRKLNLTSLDNLTNEEVEFWKNSYENFVFILN